MELKIIDSAGAEKGKINLPVQFTEPVRSDLVKRAVLAIQTHKRQPYGSSIEAGMRHSAKLSRRRRNYRGAYGKGIGRTPRKIMNRRGTQMHWVGAMAPNTVGGRRAHPPKTDRLWAVKINIQERRKAIRSALAAVMQQELVKTRGHIVPANYPFILANDIENVDRTKKAVEILGKLNLANELTRAAQKSIRAGKGKLRGRKYQRKTGPLLVVSKDCLLEKSACNIPGIDVVKINNINAELLAPGTHLGRLTLFTQAAIEKLGKEKLFM